MTLLGGRVLVKAEPVDLEVGQIRRPDSWIPRPDRGEVLAVAADSPVLAKVGDTVLFHPRAGADYVIEGTEYTTLNAAEVIGVLPG